MEITLKIPDKLVKEVFAENVTPDEIAEWVKREISFPLFFNKLNSKKIHIPEEKVEASSTNKEYETI